MFIAMNRFRVKKGSEDAFEKVWLNRDSQLIKVPGFVEFHLLKGPEHGGLHALFLAHALAKQGDVRSLDQVGGVPRRPQGCGPEQPLYLDHPKFEGFEVRQTLRGRGRRRVNVRRRSASCSLRH